MSKDNADQIDREHPKEIDRATRIEKRILSKAKGGKGQCPFCGHDDLQTLVRPVALSEPMQPAIVVLGQTGGWPITMLVCQNCQFIMPFMEDGYLTEEAD